MDLKQLETFIEVANLKSFSRAAEKLFITQPTATNHVQALEKQLETILINRSGKTISLTEAGNLLYKHAINIVNSCEMAMFDLGTYKGKIQGHLSIYSSSVPRRSILPTIIDSFLQEYSNVTFTLSNKDSKDVIKSILKGDTDFGIVGAKYPHESLNYIDLIEDKLLVITPKNSKYPKPNYSSLSINSILEERFLFREEGSGTRNLLEKKLLENKINIKDLNVLAYIEDTETIKEMTKLGLGISFLSEKSVLDDIKLDKYKAYYIEEFDLNRKFYFVYHNKRQLSPLNETFKTFVLDYIKDH